MNIEDMNYENDYRVRAAHRRENFESINKHRKQATKRLWIIEEESGDEVEIEVKVPIKFVVCDTCGGQGSHVNPSIDSNGLTAEDFHEDPDFREEYMSGRYDVTCYGCHGEKVVPVIDSEGADDATREILELVAKQQKEEDEFEAMQAAERRMGC